MFGGSQGTAAEDSRLFDDEGQDKVLWIDGHHDQDTIVVTRPERLFRQNSTRKGSVQSCSGVLQFGTISEISRCLMALCRFDSVDSFNLSEHAMVYTSYCACICSSSLCPGSLVI